MLVVFSHIGRVGSTVIGLTLGQHPDIKYRGEPFLHKSIDQVDIEKLISKEHKHTIISVQDYQASLFDIEHRCRNAPLHISISRMNILKKIISSMVAKRDKIYHSIDREYNPAEIYKPIHLDPHSINLKGQVKSLKDWLYTFYKWQWEMEQICSTNIFYEKHIQKDPVVACNLITLDLNLSPFDYKPKLQKLLPDRISDLISNFEEVEQYLRDVQSPWRFLINS